jgi:hypothetical protein
MLLSRMGLNPTILRQAPGLRASLQPSPSSSLTRPPLPRERFSSWASTRRVNALKNARRERATSSTDCTANGSILYGTTSSGSFLSPSSRPRLQATRSSVLMWTMLIPAPIALRKSSSSVPDPPCRVKADRA